jgi:hypothetical protein
MAGDFAEVAIPRLAAPRMLDMHGPVTPKKRSSASAARRRRSRLALAGPY